MFQLLADIREAVYVYRNGYSLSFWLKSRALFLRALAVSELPIKDAKKILARLGYSDDMTDALVSESQNIRAGQSGLSEGFTKTYDAEISR